MPEGFRYLGDLLSAEEEDLLARELEALPFTPFDFHGYEANRRVVGFGFRYDYSRREVVEAPPVPSFLEPLRRKIGEAFDRPAENFEQILINEYRPGAGIGWHRDKPQFAEVVGRFAACALQLPSSPEVGRHLGSVFTDGRAALRLPDDGSLAHGLGAQHPAAGSPSLFHHFSHIRQAASRGN